ncbi:MULTISPECIES: cyanophycinase [Rufibacter]|uniref:Cyanophycinase n=1 Tax=Rufibacter quisquiliarum TaxID=1549639 RepID=A0A839G8S1_9BACT|nr:MULTISPECIES: cyanophycinase [Rufibacter]MBA9075392.1 cyanophycinase [Rufibacter quisquiliarum]
MADAKNAPKQPPKGSRLIPKGKLLAIGGKEDKGQGQAQDKDQNINFVDEQILKRFVTELKGDNPLVVVIPTASQEPVQSGQDYVQVFQQLGVANVQVMDIRTRRDALQPEHVETVNQAAGIMFTGGDQLRLTSIFGGTDLLEAMKERYAFTNIIIAGTSAGAAAMSTPMIYEGESDGGYIKGDVRLTTGLEFLKDVAIDTHFLARGRIVRMTQAIATNPECIGIGLEEDTAILVTEGGKVEVIGSGLITVVDGMGITETNIFDIQNGEPFTAKGLKVHLLGDKDEYFIPSYSRVQLK